MDDLLHKHIWLIVVIYLLMAIGALTIVAVRGAGAVGNPVVAYFQDMFHMYPGSFFPANPNYPNAPRLRYMQTKPVGGGVFAVYVKVY